jgi:hypothetical protein
MFAGDDYGVGKFPLSQPVILRLGEESIRATACVDSAGFFAKPQNDRLRELSAALLQGLIVETLGKG